MLLYIHIVHRVTDEMLFIQQSRTDRLPSFQDERISEQQMRSAGVGGQGSWGQSSAPRQSYYRYYSGTGSQGGPLVSEVTASSL